MVFLFLTSLKTNLLKNRLTKFYLRSLLFCFQKTFYSLCAPWKYHSKEWRVENSTGRLGLSARRGR